MWKVADISQEIVLSRLEGLLPRYYGPGTAYSFALLTEKMRVHRNSVENWYHGREVPSLSNFIKLCIILGPHFAAEFFDAIGFKICASEKKKVGDFDFNAELARATSHLAQCLADGMIDERERAQMKPQLLALRDRIDDFCGGK